MRACRFCHIRVYILGMDSKRGAFPRFVLGLFPTPYPRGKPRTGFSAAGQETPFAADELGKAPRSTALRSIAIFDGTLGYYAETALTVHSLLNYLSTDGRAASVFTHCANVCSRNCPKAENNGTFLSFFFVKFLFSIRQMHLPTFLAFSSLYS